MPFYVLFFTFYVTDPRMSVFLCTVCNVYVYDEAGVPAGTRFDALPDLWRCPVCGAGKAAFRPIEGRQASDALAAVEAGASAIDVSNHGGGAAGVKLHFDYLRSDLRRGMVLTSCNSVAEVDRGIIASA